MTSRIPAAALVLALAVAAATGPARGADRLAGPVAAEVVGVIDGDTLAVQAHIWLGQVIETRVRLLGIDAPELHGRCPRERRAAQRARQALAQWVAAGPVVLTDLRADKYGGRVLARVRDAHGRDAGEGLLRAGLAMRYGGGRRGDWCARLAADAG